MFWKCFREFKIRFLKNEKIMKIETFSNKNVGRIPRVAGNMFLLLERKPIEFSLENRIWEKTVSGHSGVCFQSLNYSCTSSLICVYYSVIHCNISVLLLYCNISVTYDVSSGRENGGWDWGTVWLTDVTACSTVSLDDLSDFIQCDNLF